MAQQIANEEARSETTSTSTADEKHFLTRDERYEVASVLGIPEEDVAQERFPISRRRMEHLLFDNSEDAAFDFFDVIMKETNTIILWPTRLKVNARSKKDPYIKVRGRSRDVIAARARVITGLTEVKKVTLKIDVSYTDHSHIIGRGGNSIKEVMSSTGCHIHFPDCNRSNQWEKSNMVSITGEVERVEIARAKVRELIPLVFSFDLPVLGTIFMPMEEHSSFISSLKEEYNVHVFFRTKQKLNSTLVLVKGSGTAYSQVKEATEKLINHMRANQTEQVKIYATIEISPQHHLIVRGKDNCNLNLIKSYTRTQITFPDLQDTNLPSIKRSNVIVTGSTIDSVYSALQLLIGSLPVSLTFELPESAGDISHLHSASINERYDVVTTCKVRSKGNSFAFFVKGVERNMCNIYESYRVLMKSSEARFVTAQVPTSYLLPGAVPYCTSYPNTSFDERCLSPLSLPMASPNVMSPIASSAQPSQLPTSTSHHHNHSHLNLNLSSNLDLAYQTFLQQPYSLWSSMRPFHFSPLRPPFSEQDWGRISVGLPPLRDVTMHSPGSSNVSSRVPSPMSSPVPTPTMSPTPSIQLQNGENGFHYGKRPASPCCLDSSGSVDQLKSNAHKVKKQRLKPTELRIPTPAWSGLGFSQSSPTSSQTGSRRDLQSRSDDGDEWTTVASGASSTESLPLSNILETMRSSLIDAVTNVPNFGDLQSYLACIGMEKYYHDFDRHEATDLDIFVTLNENDLVGIGINALGARKKILMLIAELNSRKNNFRATPGAERKKNRAGLQWPES